MFLIKEMKRGKTMALGLKPGGFYFFTTRDENVKIKKNPATVDIFKKTAFPFWNMHDANGFCLKFFALKPDLQI